MSYYCEGILPNFGASKIFTNVPCPYGKFDERNDMDVAESVQLTVL